LNGGWSGTLQKGKATGTWMCQFMGLPLAGTWTGKRTTIRTAVHRAE
jgi:hypothetical protein